MLANSVKNTILYLNILKQKSNLKTYFHTINEILSYIKADIVSCNDQISIINDNIVLDGNSISSSLISGTLFGLHNKDFNLENTNKYSIYKDIKYNYVFRKVFSNNAKKQAKLFFSNLSINNDVTLTPFNSFSLGAINNLRTPIQFEDAWEKCRKASRTITIESSHTGDPFKIFVAGKEIVAIYGIVPAFIVGDGKSTIGELINILNINRKNNILYKNYPLKSVKQALDLSYIPVNGQTITVINSLQVEHGAQYIDLTSFLKDKFQNLVEHVVELFGNNPFLEITCTSDDIALGTEDISFTINRFRQNTVDIRHVFACLDDLDEIKKAAAKIFPFEPQALSFHTPKIAEEYRNSHFKSTSRTYVLQEAAYQLGLKASKLETTLLRIENPLNGQSELFRMGVSAYTSFQARQISNDKYLTKKILEAYEINTPIGFTFDINKRDIAWAQVRSLCESENKRLVMKPLDRDSGLGVTTDISTYDEFIAAWDVCQKVKSKKLVIEEQFVGDDYRVFIIQDQVCAVSQRVAAFVVGDGIHTITELVNMKNKIREKNFFFRNLPIRITEHTKHFLLKRDLNVDMVPEKGKKIQLSEVANASIGGDVIDRTMDMHPDWIPIARKTRRAIVNAYHAGLDIMMEDISISPHDQKWAIIEVNTNPDFAVQVFPGQGKPRNIGKAYLESIFGKIDIEHLTYKVSILGKVQQVGFRKWFKDICDYRSVRGYVLNKIDHNQVEAVIAAPKHILEEVIALCYQGPKLAKVDTVIWEQITMQVDKDELEIRS